jgi:enoyl-CoA hydratase/carnithine racemase
MEFQDIQFAVAEDQVATVTLNRPEAHNAFTKRMADEMVHVWKTVRETDDIHAVVIRAAGERAFCTGLDVKVGKWWADWNIWNHEDPGIFFSPRHNKVWKPVIVAVHGMCAGGGLYFLNEADIIICSDDATFFDPHANAGIVSALEPIGMVKRGIPVGEVLRWALMGIEERMSAETALRIGLVTEVLRRAELWERAQQIAGEIAARRPAAVQGTIRAIWESLDMTRTTAIQNGMAYTHIGNDLVPGERMAPELVPGGRQAPTRGRKPEVR